MHGGRAKGSPQKHGWFTQQALDDRREVRRVLFQLKQLVAEFNSDMDSNVHVPA